MSKQAEWSRRESAAAAEIGPIPPVVDQSRRETCGKSLLLFLQTYFPNSTGLSPFSQDHVGVIGRIETCLLNGGRFANAVYRGFSKTTITENAAIWAIVYGHRRYVAVYSADQIAANQLIDSITRELSENDLLAEDFPEVCIPFQKLEGMHQRCRSQLQNERQTHIRIVADHIVFPTVWGADGESSPASGGIIRAKGITSPGRGQAIKRADGVKARPDFALIDDPQTDESAKSPGQVKDRLDITAKGILKSAGHQKSIACVVNGTVIRPDDYMDQLLDHNKNPSWDSVRVPMVRSWSKEHEGLWLEYKAIRHGFNPEIVGDQARAHADATAFYAEHQATMDAGCIVSWDSCYDHDVELSSIQHAYNLYLDDGPEVFDSECQQSPQRAQVEGLDVLTPQAIANRTNGYELGTVPPAAVALTGFIDVHDDVLYWMVCGWGQRFSGWVIDYGTFPEQPPGYFEKRNATRTLRTMFPGVGTEEAILKGLTELSGRLLNRAFNRVGGGTMSLSKLLIDGGDHLEEVLHVARTSDAKERIGVSKGVGVGPADTPWKMRDLKPGQTKGFGWYTSWVDKRGFRMTFIDTNEMKTFLHRRLAVPVTAAGALTLYGTQPHQMLADHLLSEFATRTEGKGRTLYVWKLLPGRDNHWLDCTTGCAIGASMSGITLESHDAPPKPQVTSWFANTKRR